MAHLALPRHGRGASTRRDPSVSHPSTMHHLPPTIVPLPRHLPHPPMWRCSGAHRCVDNHAWPDGRLQRGWPHSRCWRGCAASTSGYNHSDCLATLSRYLVSLSCLIFVLMSFLFVSCSACLSLCCLLLDPPKYAISCLSCLVALSYLASLSRSACLLDLHNVCLFDYRRPLMWLFCRCGWS